MKDKILYFFGGAFYNFGIAKFLQDIHDCDQFALADVEQQPKKFFQNQNLVNFKKNWFFRDHVKIGTSNKPDLNYLQNVEQKYNINLWMIAYAERKFFKFNPFYTWKYDEILFVLEQECKLYETILDEVKPDFLIMGLYDQQHLHLLYDMCKAKNIKVLMLLPVRFGFRTRIAEDEKTFDFKQIPINYDQSSDKTAEELKEYFKKYDILKQVNNFKKGIKNISKWEKYKSILEFFLSDENTFENSFSSYGNTKTKILVKKPLKLLHRNRNKNFVDKNFLKKINPEEKFIYFPLHSEPERALSIAAPFYTNQIEVITSIAKSLPVGYKLYVKDHPVMDLKEGRDLKFYEEILELPNVVMLHPSVKRDDILENCSLVITINGTAGFEAAFFGKPTITFVETDYSSLPFVYTLHALDELPKVIRSMLKMQVNPSHLGSFVNYLEKNTFEYDALALVMDFYARFYNMGIVIPSKEISEKEMNSFLDDHNDTFTRIAKEYVRQFETYKK